MYIDKSDDIVGEYNNTYHRTIKVKPFDVIDNIYIDFKKEVNDKNPKFKVGDHVRISKYKNIFAKGYTPNWSEEVFVIKKVKNTVPWTYVINDLNDEEIIGTFYENKKLHKNCLLGAVTLTKTQILKNMDILVMELDLIEYQASHFLVVDLIKMC